MYLPLFLLATFFQLALAQVLPFTVTGFLDSASAKSGSASNRGGTITVSGFNIVIPDNLLVEFPAAFVPFATFAEAGSSKRAGPANEVSVTGNIINNVIYAGQFSISQLDLAFASGLIETLGSDGAIKIKNGPTLRINDPRARYSAGYTTLPFFTADDENASITSFSGFPMCVPRGSGDAKCPDTNRPAGSTSFVVPDASKMVPIRVGDYIEYSGAQVGGETIVYGMVVNIDIQTSGNQPGYVRVEDALIGVQDTSAAVEAARHRFVGLASRSDLPITIWAIDQDPCTGEESDRLVATTNVVASARNKWEVRIPRGSDIGLFTRNYRVKIGDNTITTPHGISAGSYVQPVSEWIFPELVTPGGTPPPLEFSNIGPLRNGFGPIDGQIFGQLNPWPGATAPSVVACAPPTTSTSLPPAPSPTDDSSGTSIPSATAIPSATPVPVAIVANAGIDKTVLAGTFVSLSATQSPSNLLGSDLTYSWSQISGPTTGVTLSNSATSSPSFVAPAVAVGVSQVREFRVLITHKPSGSKSNDTILVTSDRSSTSSDHPIIDALTWASRQSGTATATVRTDLVDPAGSMRIIFGPVAGGVERVMTRGQVANGMVTYTFSARSIPNYTFATVRSYITVGGSTVVVPGPQVSSLNVTPG
ncbi:hypothetical protein VTL71DRAFT_5093 [Oculimacula yallundae]|uniref:Uncharacterized protein n=1 Tax=Oculimacula yallundae TaxID=86028 RepID=A0ABR4C053_9HELO